MSVARGRAIEVRNRSRLAGYISDEQLSEVLQHYRLQVICHTFRGNATEVLHGLRLWLHQPLERPEKRWLVIHALGHYLLHRGDQFRMPDLLIDKQEHQAELFAGWLFLADTWQRMPAWELAEYHCLPQERIERWFGLVSGDMVASAGW